MGSIKGRFAPSPTGRMHLGNAFCVLLAWLSARSQGGRLLLRMEDLDPRRSRERYARMLMEDLLWKAPVLLGKRRNSIGRAAGRRNMKRPWIC